MNEIETGKEALDTMLGHLGFRAEITVDESGEIPCLQVDSDHKENIIGRRGERLDDLQYLVNRIVQRQIPDAPRLRVDCNHYREETEEKLREEVLHYAERVKESGEPFTMRPLNGYYRRIVHNALADDPAVETSSPESRDRLKRIIINPAG